jgi:hypothetical protein
VACVIKEIIQVELCISLTKSEVLGFYDSRHRGPPATRIGHKYR